jgi:hypothetical protein
MAPRRPVDRAAEAGRLFEPEPGPPPVRRARPAYDKTVRALRAGGRLEPADTAIVALGRTVADRLDELRGAEGKEFHETQVARLMFDLLGRLDNIGGPATDDFAALLAAASGTATPGD